MGQSYRHSWNAEYYPWPFVHSAITFVPIERRKPSAVQMIILHMFYIFRIFSERSCELMPIVPLKQERSTNGKTQLLQFTLCFCLNVSSSFRSFFFFFLVNFISVGCCSSCWFALCRLNMCYYCASIILRVKRLNAIRVTLHIRFVTVRCRHVQYEKLPLVLILRSRCTAWAHMLHMHASQTPMFNIMVV